MTNKALEELVQAFLDDHFGQTIDWRKVLEGESMVLDANVIGNNGEVNVLTFQSDGVRQVASPEPFDAIASAEILLANTVRMEDK
ncbi:hypothetical protein D3C87_975970 [compost metagenome]